MICPHCGFENAEGRRYCRGCAKALASAPVAKEVPVTELAPDMSSEGERPFASDSAITDSTNLAAIHAESQPPAHGVASSGGMKLVALVAGIALVTGGGIFWFLHKSGSAADAQAAQAQGAVNSVAYHPNAAALKNREHLMAAMRLIVTQQEARLADDPDDLDVCAVNTFGDDDLGHHARASHYIIDQHCQPQTADGRAIRNGFTVTATPKLEDNPADAPTYCVDQTKVIRRYADSVAVINATSTQHLTCPLDGQAVQ